VSDTYVHGYAPREAQRLQDQADTLVDLLHHDTRYPAGSQVLEAGCGVGAQTLTLARQNPQASFTSIDRSAESLAQAEHSVGLAGLHNVSFHQADIFALPFAPASFDHVFVCFVLEHLHHPVQALAALRSMLRPGGTVTVIEGDHGSTLFHPDGADARAAIGCQVELQRRAGGNALIGRELYRLLAAAGFDAPRVTPRMVYVDAGRPARVEGFTERTFIAMVEAVREQALAAGMISAERFDSGIRQLRRTTLGDGMFGYTFFKAVATHSA
jgi:ubiquinone/menaquinone biosynthesis C-methylase UbiE